RPCSPARLLPASTRFLAISTPRTFAPSAASGIAVVPSPQPRSRTRRPFVMPRLFTSASPLSLMLPAIRVKSPFSHRAWFGLVVSVVTVVSLSKAAYLTPFDGLGVPRISGDTRPQFIVRALHLRVVFINVL